MSREKNGTALLIVLVFLFPFKAWALGVNTDDRSSFSGRIYAVQEDNYLKFISKKEIVYTINEEAIQRVVSRSDTSQSGIVIYPAKKEVLLFRNDLVKKVFAKVTLADYLAFTQEKTGIRKLSNDGAFGFSTYFKAIKPGGTVDKKVSPKAAVYDNQSCDQLIIEQSVKEKKEQLAIIYSDHLGIPKSWLSMTELGIPDAVGGFPFRSTLRVVDAGANGQSQENAPTSKLDRAKNFLGRLAGKTERWVDELNEFTYEVTRVESRTISHASFFQPAGYKRVNNIQELEQAFASQPDTDQGER